MSNHGFNEENNQNRSFGSNESGSSVLEKSLRKRAERTKRASAGKKFAIFMLCALLIGVAVFGIVYHTESINEINKVIELIDCLPESADEIDEFGTFDGVISEANAAYLALADWQKEKVTNSDKLLSLLPEYNQYKVEKLRSMANNVTVEIVQSGTLLSDTISLYQSLTDDQRALLSSEEITKFDNYVKIRQVITGIEEIDADVLANYEKAEELKKVYNSISSSYRDLVYNYGLMESFEGRKNLFNLLDFEQLENGTYSVKVKDPKNISGEIIIPSTYEGQYVTVISERAFTGCNKITSLVVPDSVIQIGFGAFEGCSRLEKIELPFVGRSEAATDCAAVFGYIFGYNWLNGEGLESGFINKQFGSLDEATWQYTYVHEGRMRSFYYYIPQSLVSVTVTKQTEIPVAAFNGCKNIESINYTNRVESIGVAAFQNCNALKQFNSEIEGTLNLNCDIEKIPSYAFKNCYNIDTLLLSENILTIDNEAFYGCKKINDLVLPSRIIKIGEFAFYGLREVKTVNVPKTVEVIGKAAFRGCNSIEKITLPFIGKNRDASYYNAVFGYIFGYEQKDKYYGYELSNVFQNVNYHDTPQGTIWQYSCMRGSFGNSSFYYYIPSSLKEVVITEQTEVKTAAFNGCTMLTDITFERGIESQGEAAFQNCNATIHNEAE